MRSLKHLFQLVLVAALLWVGGLVWFAEDIPREPGDEATATDAIVVLTGGSMRLENGFRLLATGKAKKLFVSGVYHGVQIAELLRTAGAPDTLAPDIVLGHDADNTHGNALETAAFMHVQGYHSLRLVTSAYHMPRSLLEFSRAMPAMTIVANPVFAENVKQGQWWAWPGTLNLIVNEYDKYLAALIRPIFVHEAEGQELRP